MTVARSTIRALAAALTLAAAAPTLAGENGKILDWATMAGVQPPFVGATNPIRGVGGAGAPWSIDRVTGVLRVDGELDIEVRGLVLTATGANPAATFRAIVSCLTAAVNDSPPPALVPATVNVSTAEFPATPTGDARIRETVALPDPCYAPIVFVTNAAGRWFAVTGASTVDDRP
jgi:hypothetical protein